jgi:DNA polymerase II large subunit
MIDMELKDLTREQKEALLIELEAEKKAETERVASERATYKSIVDSTVREQVKRLQNVSSTMLEAKNRVFEAFETVIEMKSELYGVRERQQSHTFTTEDGEVSVTIGHRVNEGWDDTVGAGISKVQVFLKTLARDDNSSALVETVMRLLARDRKGNLKTSKVLEPDKLADKVGNADFLDGIRIIKEAYRPTPTCQFVDVSMKDAHGVWHSLPLSISAIVGELKVKN